MTKATIQSVRQTEKAGLFTICFEGESFTEFQNSSLRATRMQLSSLICKRF